MMPLGGDGRKRIVILGGGFAGVYTAQSLEKALGRRDDFKLVTEGMRPPAGEVYQAVEGANGELGFYLVSNGTGQPWKCRCRAPSFTCAT